MIQKYPDKSNIRRNRCFFFFLFFWLRSRRGCGPSAGKTQHSAGKTWWQEGSERTESGVQWLVMHFFQQGSVSYPESTAFSDSATRHWWLFHPVTESSHNCFSTGRCYPGEPGPIFPGQGHAYVTYNMNFLSLLPLWGEISLYLWKSLLNKL